MKIPEAKQAYRLQERMRVVREQRESGLTVRAWCGANNVKESSFYYWLREMRKAALQTNEGKDPKGEQQVAAVAEMENGQCDMLPSGWVQIQAAEEPRPKQTGSAALSIEIGGCKVAVEESTTPELLAKVCRVLKSL